MSQRFSITPATAAVDLDLTDSIFRTLSVIGIYGDRNGWCWPSQSTLAELRGVSRQTINAHIKELIKAGYLNIQPRYDEETGAQKSNMMQIKFDFDFTPPVKLRLYTPNQAQDLTHNAPPNDPIEVLEEEEQPPNIFKLYEQNIGPMVPTIAQDMDDLAQELPAFWFEEAFKIAAANGARNWSYCKAILLKWKAKGYGYDDRPKKGKGNGNTKGFIKPTETTDEERDLEHARQLLRSGRA